MDLIERVHLLSHADNLKPLRSVVKELSSKQGCDEKNIDCMVMAINEACMNVIQHAYGDHEEGEIIIDFLKEENELIVRIYDFAEKVDCNTIKSRDLDDVRPGGIGVHIMNEVMDKIEYKEGPDGVGNLLELRKKIDTKNNKESKCEEK
jgi:anti-sigma regulatory factor (Ser/Thr protein kinase)